MYGTWNAIMVHLIGIFHAMKSGSVLQILRFSNLRHRKVAYGLMACWLESRRILEEHHMSFLVSIVTYRRSKEKKKGFDGRK